MSDHDGLSAEACSCLRNMSRAASFDGTEAALAVVENALSTQAELSTEDIAFLSSVRDLYANALDTNFRPAHGASSDNADALYIRALMYQGRGEYENAVRSMWEYLTQCRIGSPAFACACGLLSDFLELAGNPSAARAAAEVSMSHLSLIEHLDSMSIIPTEPVEPPCLHEVANLELVREYAHPFTVATRVLNRGYDPFWAGVLEHWMATTDRDTPARAMAREAIQRANALHPGS